MLYLQEGFPVCGDFLVVLVDQSRLFLDINALVVGEVEDLGLLPLFSLYLDKEVEILIVV